jgi:acetylornithine/N-succinyldiaminopimelate aminotransferase
MSMKSNIMPTYNRKPVTFVRGDGVYLYDDKGNKYIDALCGLAVTSLGHSHPIISQAIKKQSQTLLHTSNAFIIDHQEMLAKRLCQLTGMDNAFFCNSGAEAVEAAIKIARKYGHERGFSNPKIIVMSNSFHGRTMGAMSATSNKNSHESFGPIIDGLIRVNFNDIDDIKNVIASNGDISAVLLEPIQGEGGIISCDIEYLQELDKLCKEKDILLMTDEVQSGFCRTGRWFSYQHFNIIPDVVMVAKALGNGVPIGACLAKNDAANILKAGMHGSTFGGNYLSTAVGLAVLDVMRDSQICMNVKHISDVMKNACDSQLNPLNAVSEIRIYGMMIGVELKINCTELVVKALEKGLVLNVTKEKIIRLLPPLICKDEHIIKIVDIIKQLIKENYEN